MERSDEDYITSVVNNADEGIYNEFQRIIEIPWWDDDDKTWNDVAKAAGDLRGLVDPLVGQFEDLDGIDLNGVDWWLIIAEELQERNKQEGRDSQAGL